MKVKNDIFIRNEQKIIKVDAALRAIIKKAVNATLEYEEFGVPAEISVLLTDDEAIHELNLQYRDTDRPTDVLSFPTEDDEEDGEDGSTVLGDIVISLERAKAQSEEYGHSFEREVAFLTVHSVLHLLGYDHEISEEDEKDMFRRQSEILESAGITRE